MGNTDSTTPSSPPLFTCLYTLNDNHFGEYKLLQPSLPSSSPPSILHPSSSPHPPSSPPPSFLLPPSSIPPPSLAPLPSSPGYHPPSQILTFSSSDPPFASSLYILKTFYFGSSSELEKFIKECEIRKNLSNILKLLSIKKEGTSGSFCTEVQRVRVLFEYIDKTLEDELASSASAFSLSDCYFLLSCILNSLNSLHSLSIRHFDICPANIFKWENGTYVLHDAQFMGGINSYTQILTGGVRRNVGRRNKGGWKREETRRERGEEEGKRTEGGWREKERGGRREGGGGRRDGGGEGGEGEECYLAPEIFNELFNKTLDPGFNEKSEVFSIGMTLLRTIVGDEIRKCYDWNEFKFIPSSLSSILSSIPPSFSTSLSPPSSSLVPPPTFLDLLKGMLAINPSERFTLSQLSQKLKIYNQTIQELEGVGREEEEGMKDEGRSRERGGKEEESEEERRRIEEEGREEVKWLYKEFGRIMEEGRKEEGKHYSKEVLGVRKALMEDDYLECSLRREEVLRRSMVGREERGKRRRREEEMIGGREIYDMYLQEYEILKSQG